MTSLPSLITANDLDGYATSLDSEVDLLSQGVGPYADIPDTARYHLIKRLARMVDVLHHTADRIRVFS